jgi:hypothetical protein
MEQQKSGPLPEEKNMASVYQSNPQLDLRFTRIVDVPKDLIWRAWTEPELLKPWFCPLPWKTVDCEIDLRPGGIFRTTMQSPEGKEFPNTGCYLEVTPDKKLVWTNALLPGSAFDCVDDRSGPPCRYAYCGLVNEGRFQ